MNDGSGGGTRVGALGESTVRTIITTLCLIVLGLGGCGGAPSSPTPADAAEDHLSKSDTPVPDTSDVVMPDALDASAVIDAAADTLDAPVEDHTIAPDVARDAPDAPGGCTADSACVGNPEGPVCDLASGRCVPCTPTNNRCPAGQYCVAGMNRCMAGCRDDASCGAGGDGGVRRCDTTSRTCVDCVRDDHCAAGALCVGSVCVPGCSATRPCPAGQSCCGGGCADTQTNVASCGGCDARCSIPNATPICRAGACALGSCVAPFANCDGDASNGCETDTRTSMSACGACGSPCVARPNSMVNCEMGTCRYTCTGSFGDCDGNAANGCETDLSATPNHCGMCGRACSLRNATTGCTLGACTVASCAAGFGDCNTNPADGCETDVRESLSHCGGCGRRCAPTNSIPVCSAGTCRLVGCDVGYGDCDRSATNGCEVAVTTVTNCSACGVACPAPTGPHAVARCNPSGGTFVCGAVCESGYVDCDGNLANGCEALGSCTVERELFYDGFEGGGSRWIMDPVWRVTNAGFYSPCAGTLEMFGEKRVSDPCDVAGDVTLASPIDISRATTLTLTHQSRSYVSGGIRLDVSASGDGGRSWSVVATQGSATCGPTSINLSAFVGRSTLLLRFSYQGTRVCDSGFWRLDEVRVRASVRNY